MFGIWHLLHQTPCIRARFFTCNACRRRYRTREEMVAWRARDPVVRFRHWLVSNGWWDEAQEKQLRHATRQQVRQ
jgi:TPP-dependent pyruvate/acetoin dehydrogenase alpha subunit